MLEPELSTFDGDELTLLFVFAGSLLTVELVFILLSDEFILLPSLELLPELPAGSFVAVEPFAVLLSLVTPAFTTALGLSLTTLPELLFVVASPSPATLLAVEALSTVLLALVLLFTGALLPKDELSPPLLPPDTIRALPAPLPYPPIEPRCP